ncbi:MAG TPA: aminoacyl-tRNA hydrolase [Patescibacteria group bacterium]
MKMFVGLGNPGDSYAKNRHNVGFMVIDSLNAYMEGEHKKVIPLSQRSQIKLLQATVIEYPPHALLAKPLVFMNDSGLAVKRLIGRFKTPLNDLYIIHDDLDIPLGEYKIQKAKGPALHNGLLSVENELGSNDFVRIRVGVDNRDQNLRVPGEVYVLQNFAKDEEEKLGIVISKIVEEITKTWQ